MTQTPSVNPQMANTNDFNLNIAQIDNCCWSGIFKSTYETGTINVRSNPSITGVSNWELEAFQGNVPLATFMMENETALPNILQLQQYQFGNPNLGNEYGDLPSISSRATGTPIAIQAIPTLPPTVLQQRSRNSIDVFTQNSTSAAYQASPSTQLFADGFSTIRSTSSQASRMPSSSLQQYLGIQHNIGLQTPNQMPNAYRVSYERQSSSPSQMANLAASHAINQSFGQVQSSIQPSVNFLGPQMHGVSSQSGVDRSTGISRLMGPNQRHQPMARGVETSRTHPYSLNADAHRMPTVAHQIENRGVTSLSVGRTDAHDQADQNWRPTAQMRGALSGQAYSDALNQFILRPTPQPQAARPCSNAGLLPG